MDRYERILTLHRILQSARYPVPLARIMEELGCSRATAYRDIAFLRDALGAPLDSDGENAAFRYATEEAERSAYREELNQLSEYVSMGEGI